jgi:hypothetical protein
MYGSKHLSVSTHTAVRMDESVSQIVHAASICDRVANSDNNCSCLRPKLEEVQTRVRNLISKWTAGMDNSRHQADSGAKYSLYFDLLRDRANVYSKQLLKFLIAG